MAQVRAPHRSAAARHFAFNGQFTGNPVADFLLGYCSTCTGAFGSSRSTYRSPTVAPFIDDVWNVSPKLTLQLGLRWEYLAPWHDKNDLEGAFDRVSGKIAYHQVPANLPAQLRAAGHPPGRVLPAGIMEKDLNNLGPRVGVAYNVNDRTVVRGGFGVYYDNLNLNELQFTRLVPPFYGQFSLTPVRTAPLLVDTLFPNLNNIPQFPAPFSIDPENRIAVHAPVERQRPAHTSAATTSSKWPTPAAGATTSTSASTSIRRRPGTTPIETRVPYPAFQSAILYSSDEGWAQFHGLSFRAREAVFATGCSSSRTIRCRRTRDNGSGEIEANDTAFAWDLDADESLLALRSAAPQRVQLRLRAAVRRRQALARQGGAGRLHPRRLAGAGRRAVGQRIPIHGHVDERLPVRLVRSAARQLRARTGERQRPAR